MISNQCKLGQTRVTLVAHSGCSSEGGFASAFRLWATRISSNSLRSGFASDLDTVQQKQLQNFGRPTETVFGQWPRCYGGIRHLQKEESHLRMNLAAEGLQFQELMQMSTEFGILCVQFIGWQSERLGQNWIWVTPPFIRYCSMNLGWEKSAQSRFWNLMQDQTGMRRDWCIDFFKSIENDPHFVEHVITGDETWVFEYDPETECQSMEWQALQG